MNEDTRLILKNQLAIMNVINFVMLNTRQDDTQDSFGDIQRQIIESYEKTREALAPANSEFDFKDTLSTPKEKVK